LSRTSTSLHAVAGRGERRPGIGVTLAIVMASVRKTLSLWRDRVRHRRALARMSERELTDLGVCWSQIADEVGKPFWRA
jgi:uncharacterized protein YjiS (DUF1127 family)